MDKFIHRGGDGTPSDGDVVGLGVMLGVEEGVGLSVGDDVGLGITVSLFGNSSTHPATNTTAINNPDNTTINPLFLVISRHLS
ncbi:MAG: hypothetical protein PHI74_02470 [Methanocellales archaeon]|nr:hypothetical protein [Methanocellales archaeon]MDD3291341.1 hypothetical protein [Methanocellales archaeon]MDD5484880.1 hypothetical protein [Methanocellales archaeon]